MSLLHLTHQTEHVIKRDATPLRLLPLASIRRIFCALRLVTNRAEHCIQSWSHILLFGKLRLSGLRRKGVVLCGCAMYGLDVGNDGSDLCEGGLV